jgi:diguanylate cyclase (GGDEF)-like protein/putative nucleotidyltransferase with HDIG domain
VGLSKEERLPRISRRFQVKRNSFLSLIRRLLTWHSPFTPEEFLKTEIFLWYCRWLFALLVFIFYLWGGPEVLFLSLATLFFLILYNIAVYATFKIISDKVPRPRFRQIAEVGRLFEILFVSLALGVAQNRIGYMPYNGIYAIYILISVISGGATVFLRTLIFTFGVMNLSGAIAGLNFHDVLANALAYSVIFLIMGLVTIYFESLENMARVTSLDQLTGILNHRSLMERLAEETTRAARFEHPLGLALIDIDNFRKINEWCGHRRGDSILRQLAKIIKSSVRAFDIVGRFGGEEFLVILPEANERSTTSVAERIRKAIANHKFGIENQPVPAVTVSIGIASFPQDGTSKEILLSNAQIALDTAKRLGRNQVMTFRNIPTLIPSDLKVEKYSSPEVENILLSAVYSLAAAVDARDHYTKSHSTFVSQAAAATASILGLDKKSIKAIAVAGLLHDIGKVGVPDSILQKAGPLLKEEWEIMKKHPRLGAQIVEKIPGLQDILPLILYHQEKYDGSGYPDGLAGTKIPLGARILAVADAFHAMISNRPYRKKMSLLKAIEELKKNAGSQFDPKVIEAFIEVLSKDFNQKTVDILTLPLLSNLLTKFKDFQNINFFSQDESATNI